MNPSESSVESGVAIWRHTLGDLLRRTAARFPAKVAIVCGEVWWTYAEFDEVCNRARSARRTRSASARSQLEPHIAHPSCEAHMLKTRIDRFHPLIVVRNEATVVSDADVRRTLRALQKQINRDFAGLGPQGKACLRSTARTRDADSDPRCFRRGW
jgi:hypothetical protein